MPGLNFILSDAASFLPDNQLKKIMFRHASPNISRVTKNILEGKGNYLSLGTIRELLGWVKGTVRLVMIRNYNCNFLHIIFLIDVK